MTLIINNIFLSWYDVAIVPFYLLGILVFIYFTSREIKDKTVRTYFLYGVFAKMIMAVLYGVVYSFFYRGGDTYEYYSKGLVISNAFWDSPLKWMKLILHFSDDPSIYKYIYKIGWWYDDPSTSIPCRIVGFLAPFCFDTYSVIALFFSLINFSGLWFCFLTLYRTYPKLHREIAFSLFFVPSVVFWGAGIMKDGLTLSALGFVFYGFHEGLIMGNNKIKNTIIMLSAAYFLALIKIYVLLCFVPAAAIWLYNVYNKKIKNKVTRMIVKPLIIAFGIGIGISFSYMISSIDSRYSLEKIETTSKITREYLYYVSEKVGGSSYSLGHFSGELSDYFINFPAAVNVALFRPYPWEVKNLFMLLSSLESFFMLFLLIYVLYKVGIVRTVTLISKNNFLLFCFIFCVFFAFAVGITTFNFGTLARYRIPLLPFYFIAIFIVRGVKHKKLVV